MPQPRDLAQPLGRVLILAGDCDGNLGDKAIVRATCDELRRLNPGLRIDLKSNLAEADCLDYFGAHPIPRGPRYLLRTLRAAAAADLVLVGGGGLFQDDDSLVKMPYWGLKVAIVRTVARRMVGYSLGAGPLHSRLGRWFGRLAMACLDRISVRDHTGQATLQPLTRKPVEIVPDPAILLRCPSTNSAIVDAALDPADPRPLIGVALREWFHQTRSFIPHKYAVKYRLRAVPGGPERAVFTPLMAAALDDIVQATGARLLFLPSYNVGHEGDHRCCERVMAAMQTRGHALLQLEDPVDYLRLGRHLRLMLSARLHPLILTTSVGVPPVGLAYNPKFLGYFSKLGLEGQLLDLGGLLTPEARQRLVQKVLSTLATPPEMQSAIEVQQARLEQFNAEVFRR